MTGTRFEIRKSRTNKYYFVLIARNGEIICTSEMYEAKDSCIKGIKAIKRYSLFAGIKDTTLVS
ncbi:MAG: YegP family protein [Sediminibacterium sp.]